MKAFIRLNRMLLNKGMVWRAGAVSAAAVTTLMAFAAPLSAQTTPPRSLAPNTDFSKICVVPPKVALTRDWKKWDKPQPINDLDEMYEAAALYADGAADVARDPLTARKLLEELIGKSWPGKARAHYRLGKLLLDSDAGPVDTERAASLFASAAAMLNMDASVQLGRLHEQGRIAGASATEAERLFRTASAAGNVDGVIGLARLQRSGRLGEVPQSATDDLIKLGLLIHYGDLGRGKCSALFGIGSILSDDALVPAGLPEAMKWFEAAARHGDPRGDMALAEIYMQGRVRSAPDVIVKHLARAAEAGVPRAMILLGERLLRGDGAPQDTPKAVAWLEKAGAYADPDAYRLLARHYGGEFGSAPDLPKAADALTRAIALPGHKANVLIALGRLHVLGVNGQPDIQTAMTFYRQAADRGETTALTELAKLLVTHPRETNGGDDVMRLLKEAAERGNGDAMGLLSDLYACSAVIAPDPEQAKSWLVRAAEAGHSRSINTLVSRTKGNPAAARQNADLLLRAAKQGDRESMILLSLAYRAGQGVDVDDGAAAQWREAALAPGEDRPRALFLMARRLLIGEDEVRDEAAARTLLEDAAQAGDPGAQFELGRLLLSVKHSEGSEASRGLMLLQQAATSGNAAAMLTLAELSNDQLRSTGKTALAWRRAAAEAGSARAAIALASSAKDNAEAADWLARTETLPVCAARDMVELAQIYHKSPDASSKERANKWLQRAVNEVQTDEADPGVLFLIGRAMLNGVGGMTNSESALDYMKRSADAGKIEAMRFLGRGYASGQFGERNAGAAAEWLTKALRQGDESAAIDLARLAATSDGHAAGAVVSLKEGAEAGFVPAMREYGRSLQFGFGVPAEPERGASWLRRAADSGDTIAMKELSRAYASGYGVELSAHESTEWLLRAAKAGDAEAMYGLSLALTLGFGTEVNATAAQEWMATAEATTRK
jgi:TPR repeat protein